MQTSLWKYTSDNLGRVFNSRSGHVHVLQLHLSETEQPNLKLNTWPKPLLGSLQMPLETIILLSSSAFRLFVNGVVSN